MYNEVELWLFPDTDISELRAVPGPKAPGLGEFQCIHHYIFFLWLQRSIGQPKVIFLHISKNHNKKKDNQKKKVRYPGHPTWSFLSLDFFRRDVDLYSE